MIYNILMTALLAVALVRCYLLRKTNIRFQTKFEDLIPVNKVPLGYRIFEYDTYIAVELLHVRPISRECLFAPLKKFPFYKYDNDKDFARREAEELLDKLKEK